MILKIGKIMKRFFIILVFFTMSCYFLLAQLDDRFEHQRNIIFNDHEKLVQNQYKVIISILRNLSNTTYQNLINKEEVKTYFAQRDRKKLLKFLEKDYQNLEQIGFTQVHFHLPNNESFLRMHQPDMFGDDLTTARYSVDYVNKNKQSIEGIEVGKVVPGYRFVYPLFLDEQYLGSVELSFGIHKIVQEIENVYDTHVHYLINKNIFNQKVNDKFTRFYTSSIEHKDYIKLNREYKNKMRPWYDDPEMNKILNTNIINQKVFSMEITGLRSNKSDEHTLVTFMPVKNVQGDSFSYFVFYSNNLDLHIMQIKSLQLKVFVVFLLAILFVILYFISFKQAKISASKDEMEQFNKVLEARVEEKTNKLNEINQNLEKKIEEQVAINREKDRQIYEQSKKAAMGDMLGSIAHQWRQPLNELSIRIQNIRFDFDHSRIDEEYIKNFIDTNKKTIEYMSNTVEDFRNFFKIDKIKIEFDVKASIENCLNLQQSVFDRHSINVNVQGESFYINGFKNEFQQVIINILTNSKDQFLEKNIEDPTIQINTENKKIYIKDNAGGIPQKVVDRIFEPYFTTKAQNNGTGMGLYMSHIIIEKNMNAKLYCQNDYPNGVTFVIDFSQSGDV